MVRFLIIMLVLAAAAAGTLGWLWSVANSLETPPRTVEKVIPYAKGR